MMKVVVQMQSGEEHTFEEPELKVEREKYKLFIYGGREGRRVLAVFDHSDIKSLITGETPAA
jgi:hypothetical protein